MLAVTEQYRAWFSRTSESKWFRGILEGAHFINIYLGMNLSVQRWREKKIELTLGGAEETNGV